MSIKLFLPASLNYLVGGKDLFELNGGTVGECFNQLVSIAPVMKNALFFESGDWLHPTIKVLVNQESVDQEVLAKTLKDGDEVQIKTNRH